MATVYTGTAGNDTVRIEVGGTVILDGLGGVDTLAFGTALRENFTIVQNSDGSINVDTLSGASAPLKATFKNWEILTFNNGKDKVDLQTYFGPIVVPTATITDSTLGAATGEVTYTFSFNETVTGLTASDFTVTNGSVTSVSGSGATYSVVVSPQPGIEGSMGLTLNSGAVTDALGTSNAGPITAAAQAIDTKPPTIVALSPLNTASGVPTDSNIVLAFGEPISIGAGTISITNSTGTVIQTFDAAASASVSISGNVLTIHPSSSLLNGASYQIVVPLGAVKDTAGNAYAGIGNYTFTTIATGQVFIGTSANDTFAGTPGNDTIDGAAEIDTATFSGKSTEYLITYDAISSTYSVKDGVSSRDGTDKLTSVELLQFSDGVKQLATSDALLVGRVYQSLFGKAQSSATFNESLAKVGPSGSAFDWAKAEATGFSALSDSAFTTLVLNNMSINITSLTATTAFGTASQAYDTLQQAMTVYLGWVGSANRGIVTAQVAQIIAGFEGETIYGVYGAAATAFNKQVASDIAHSINTQNTSEVATVPVFSSGAVSALGDAFTYMVAMGSYNYRIGGFASGDRVIGPAGVSGTLVNANATDGVAAVQYVSGGQTVSITLTGLTTTQDGALHLVDDLNTVFGIGTLL